MAVADDSFYAVTFNAIEQVDGWRVIANYADGSCDSSVAPTVAEGLSNLGWKIASAWEDQGEPIETTAVEATRPLTEGS